VYTEFATSTRCPTAEPRLIAGRGSSLIESFPLFRSTNIADYEDLYEEKLDLLMRLLRDQTCDMVGEVSAPHSRTST